MKRLGLMTVLLLGSVLSAQADNDVYYNTLKHPRSDDALQADTETCNEQFGAPDNGTVTSQAYKRCMLGHGWKFSHTERQSAGQNGEYPDPDNPGLMCRNFIIGGVTGSDCSNY